MTHDLLERATKALEESGHDQQGGRFTRERLMASLHETKRKKSVRFAVFLPLAAIFVGSTAFAAVTGHLEVIVMSALDVVGVTEPEVRVPAAPPVAPAARAQGQKPRSAPAAPAVVEPARSAEPAPEAEAPATLREQTSTPVRRTTSSRSPEPDDAHAVYRSAHAAQFKLNDAAGAIRGYEAYLAVQPGGRFAVDARYNRALCLVRVGRQAEARVELARFASGSYGGYRRGDAERLLAALDEAAGK
jgi:hypothetical protein